MVSPSHEHGTLVTYINISNEAFSHDKEDNSPDNYPNGSTLQCVTYLEIVDFQNVIDKLL